MPSNAISATINMHDIMLENTEMLKVMLENMRRLHNFLFGGDYEPVPKDDTCCMMDEAVKHQTLLRMCLDTMTCVFDKLGTNG